MNTYLDCLVRDCVLKSPEEVWDWVGIPEDQRGAPFYKWKGGYLYGPVGRGKSYRAAGRLKTAVREACHRGKPTHEGAQEIWGRFIKLPDLVTVCREVYSKKQGTLSRWVDAAAEAYPLVLDDIGVGKMTDFVVNEVLYPIVDSRAAMGLPTLVTGNLSPSALSAIDPRIASRVMSFGPAQLLTGPDLRQRYDPEENPLEVIEENNVLSFKA